MSYCYSDEVDALLKRLNKPALRSIKSPDGDIIDCVHISQQPSLDHPSLKNHSIQMRPRYIPGGLANEKEGSLKQMWHLSGSCPKETIPIRRTTREDILRASTAITNQGGGIERAITHLEGGSYYGTNATINLWHPVVQTEVEYSSSQIWIKAGSKDSELNTIEVGWQVYPAIYGDHNTRLFIRWTSDGHNLTGCYDLKCEGFNQTS
ncbi:neprosin family protein, partial [Salmonella sp. s57402]|uniref:neprosin family protein n=1 Tax=Salmonella sp. s57402 TaxID=3159695 RepID=UPI0039816EB4